MAIKDVLGERLGLRAAGAIAAARMVGPVGLEPTTKGL
jgi:hypothetical protein